MMIQKAVLCGIASLLVTSTATAQYSARPRTVYAHPSYHRVHHLSYGYPQINYSVSHHPKQMRFLSAPQVLRLVNFRTLTN